MIGYFLYFLLAVGLSILLTAVFRRLRRDDQNIVPLKDDDAFNRRMAEIEKRFGRSQDQGGDGGQEPG